MALFTGAVCFEVFFHCYYGNEITLKSRLFSTSLFHSKWIEIQSDDRKIKKSMRIVMENFKKELKVSNFGIYVLNLSSFMTILNSTYSYLMLLIQLRSKGFK